MGSKASAVLMHRRLAAERETASSSPCSAPVTIVRRKRPYKDLGTGAHGAGDAGRGVVDMAAPDSGRDDGDVEAADADDTEGALAESGCGMDTGQSVA